MAHSVLLKGPSNYAADLRLGKHRYGVELNFLFGCPVWSGKPTSLAWLPLPKRVVQSHSITVVEPTGEAWMRDPNTVAAIVEVLRQVHGDLAPKIYPVPSSPRPLDLPCWAVGATGAGAEPLA